MSAENLHNNQESFIQDDQAELKEYYLSLLKEQEEEREKNDPVSQRCKFVSFISTSSGVNRKRRPREVNLLVVDHRYAYQVIRGEIKPRRKHDHHVQADVLAQEVLTDVAWDERSAELLLSRAIRNLKKLY